MDGSHDGGNDRVSRERGARYAYRVHPPILLLVLLSLSLSYVSPRACTIRSVFSFSSSFFKPLG